jgi:hypothetical protein
MIQELDNLIDESIDKEEFDTYISKVRNTIREIEIMLIKINII